MFPFEEEFEGFQQSLRQRSACLFVMLEYCTRRIFHRKVCHLANYFAVGVSGTKCPGTLSKFRRNPSRNLSIILLSAQRQTHTEHRHTSGQAEKFYGITN